MIRTRTYLIIVLMIPIVILLALTFYKKNILSQGTEVILPITGYDPRDLLSGHFITYKVEYGIPNLCASNHEGMKGYVCLTNKTFSQSFDESCNLYVKGVCHYGRFEAGIEKYFIPESRASELNKVVIDKKASIVISVMPSGQALVKDLLIDGKSWREWKAEP